MKPKKSRRELLADDKMRPKVARVPGKMSKGWGEGFSKGYDHRSRPSEKPAH